MKGNRKKRVFPSGGSLYSSSSPLGRARPSRRKKRNGQRADPCRGADCLGPRERAHPAYETVNLTIMPASGIEREGTVNGIPNELEKGREGIMIACEILPDPALLRNPRKERRRMDLFIRYPSEESVFLLSPAHFFLFLFFSLFLFPFSPFVSPLLSRLFLRFLFLSFPSFDPLHVSLFSPMRITCNNNGWKDGFEVRFSGIFQATSLFQIYFLFRNKFVSFFFLFLFKYWFFRFVSSVFSICINWLIELSIKVFVRRLQKFCFFYIIGFLLLLYLLEARSFYLASDIRYRFYFLLITSLIIFFFLKKVSKKSGHPFF